MTTTRRGRSAGWVEAPGRRGWIGGALVAGARALAPWLVPAASGAGSVGCLALAGEETIEAFFVVGVGGSTSFFGWTEYELDEPLDPDTGATLERVLLRAPDGVGDLRFITSLFGELVMPSGERTPLVSGQGQDFPANDTMAALEVLYDGDLRPYFAGGRKLRVEWSGTVDPTFPFPSEGLRVDALVTIEIL